jgi:hypothetical protein
VICLLSGLLFLTVIFDKLLRKRKEVLIFASLAVGDFMFGLGTLIYAAERSKVMMDDAKKWPMTAWHCALTPQFFLQHFGQHIQAVINLAISFERFAPLLKL